MRPVEPGDRAIVVRARHPEHLGCGVTAGEFVFACQDCVPGPCREECMKIDGPNVPLPPGRGWVIPRRFLRKIDPDDEIVREEVTSVPADWEVT